MYDVGDAATLNFTIPVNATVALTVTAPDGTTSTPAVSNPGAGSYTADVPLTQAGRWAYRWVATGAVSAAQSDVIDVASATPTGIVSLADAKDHLNITSTSSDEELRNYIDAATDFIESRIGPVVRRTITETVWPQSGQLFLSAPVVSVTSLTAAYGYPGTYTVGSWSIDGSRLVAAYGTYTYESPITVVYEGGRATVPALIRQAALDYVKWMWESQRGAASPVDLVQGGEFDVQAPATVPYRILQALEPYISPVVA